jgi:hypothetical protein
VDLFDIVSLILSLCLLLVAIAGIQAYRKRARHAARPRVLVAVDGRFDAPRAGEWWTTGIPALILLNSAVYFFHDHSGYPSPIRTMTTIMCILGGAASLVAVVLMMISARVAPLAITKAGVREGRFLIRWDDVATSKRLAQRGLPITGPSVPNAMANADLATDPAYVGEAIGYYLRHPEAREAIGDPAELTRLNEALDATQSSPAVG